MKRKPCVVCRRRPRANNSGVFCAPCHEAWDSDGRELEANAAAIAWVADRARCNLVVSIIKLSKGQVQDVE